MTRRGPLPGRAHLIDDLSGLGGGPDGVRQEAGVDESGGVAVALARPVSAQRHLTPYRGPGCSLFMEVTLMDGLTIGRLARQGQVNVETIRYYERRGMLPRPPRRPSGYRVFPPSAVRVLRFVKSAQGLGFSLKEIKDLLSLRVQPGRGCADVRERAEQKIAEIDQKIRVLQAMRKALLRLAAACSGRGPISECPILESLETGGKE